MKKAISSRRQTMPAPRGMSLVDLMVGMAIGLMVVLAAVGSLIVVRNSSRSMTDSAALQQQANLAMMQIGQQISQAGSYNAYVTGQNPDAGTTNAGASAPQISGGTLGTVAFDLRPAGVNAANSTVSILGTSGGTRLAYPNTLPVADTLSISYADPNDGSPATNCAGRPAAALANGAARIVSVFAVSAPANATPMTPGSPVPSLTCDTDPPNAATPPTPIVSNVENLRVLYLTPTVNANGLITQVAYQSAAQIGNNWAATAIVGVQVCLELVGDYTQAPQQQYGLGGDCDGNTASPADGRVHLIVRDTFYLRNPV